MKRLIRFAAATAVWSATTMLACSMALAQMPAKPIENKNAPAAGSPEAQVAARFTEKSGGQKPDQVFKGRGGLYEVLVGGQIYYVDSDVSFVLAGRMFDPRTREDLTQKRLDVALKVDFKSLPLDRAVKTVRGDGSRVMVTFEDPNCGYCKRLVAEHGRTEERDDLHVPVSDSVCRFHGEIEGDLVLEGSRSKLGRAHGAEQGTCGGGLQKSARTECCFGPATRHQRHADDYFCRRHAFGGCDAGAGD